MAVVRPLYWNTTLDLARPLLDIHWEYQRRHIARLYSQAPTVTVSVVSNSGTLSPTMADTRLQAGAEGTRPFYNWLALNHGGAVWAYSN